MNQTAAIK